MTTAIDTNILLDVLIPGAANGQASQILLERAATAGELIICEVVYAEIAAHFPDGSMLAQFLRDTRIRLAPSGPSSLAQAGLVWREHRKNQGVPQCYQCGSAVALTCPACGTSVRLRQHLIADFLVGAHAVGHAVRLLSRDRGFYGRYFPELPVVGNPQAWR